MKILRIGVILFLFVIMACVFTLTAYASVPSPVVQFNATCTDTTISMVWTMATSANNTLIRYSTATYPATTADGTLAYSGNDTSYTLASLTSGTTYYISVWGYNGDYSATAFHCVVTTYSVALPSGGQTAVPPQIPIPTVPPNATQSANISSFSLRPITDIISYLDDPLYGGLGMPINNLWETIAIFGMVTVSGITYIKMRNFFIAYFVLFILTCFAVALRLVQGYLVPIEIVVGLGVWAAERFLQ